MATIHGIIAAYHSIPGALEQFPYAGIFLLLVLAGVGVPFPEDATLIFCGFLIANDVIKPLYALIVTYSGLLIGDFLIFTWGRKWGRNVVTHKRFHRILSPELFAKLEARFKRHGVLMILIGRQLWGVRVKIFLISGIMKMPRLKFIISDGVSAFITMCIMVGIGYLGGESIAALRNDVTRYEHILILGAIIFGGAGCIIWHYRRKRKKAAKAAREG